MFLFANQIEKEDQAHPTEEVAEEEFQLSGWPQLLDPLLPDPRALGQAVWFRTWCRGRRPLMPKVSTAWGPPGSLPGGERGISVLGSSPRVPAAPLGFQNSVRGSFGVTYSPSSPWFFGPGWLHCQPVFSQLSSFLSLASCCRSLKSFRSLTFFFVMRSLH